MGVLRHGALWTPLYSLDTAFHCAIPLLLFPACVDDLLEKLSIMSHSQLFSTVSFITN